MFMRQIAVVNGNKKGDNKMAKVSYPEIDKLFETMDRKTAEKMDIMKKAPKKKPAKKKGVSKKKK